MNFGGEIGTSMSESVFKVLVIGEPAVGKTSMVARYCYREWIENYKATVGGSLIQLTISSVLFSFMK